MIILIRYNVASYGMAIGHTNILTEYMIETLRQKTVFFRPKIALGSFY